MPMPSMSSPSVFIGQKSCLNPLQANTEEIKTRIHKCARSDRVSPDFPAFVSKDNRGNGHGRNSVNLLCNPVCDSGSPPPVTYAHLRCSNLDMCTETLGCETGAMCSSYELEVAALTRKSPPLTMGRRKERSAPLPEFPPPLTTLRGEERLRLGRKQEDGRLLLIPFKPFLLEAERSGGRLVLRFLPSGAAKETEEREAEEEDDEEEEELTDKDEDGAGEIGCLVYGSEGKYRRPVRCKEEGEGVGRSKMTAAAIFNCDAFWVASS